MKKVLLGLAVCFLFIQPVLLKAQPFSGQSPNDTVYATVSTTAVIHDDLTNNTGSPLQLRWSVSATNAPNDWLSTAAFGICDNNLCRNNTGDTLLWRVSSSTSGTTFTTGNYMPGVAGTFDLSMDLTGASTGTHWITVTVTDPSLYSRNITFILNKWPAAVSNVNSSESDIMLYPNPVSSELNVVYNANADIKNVAIYNIIGKVMAVYKVSGTSANMNLSNIPAGIYFIRLTNSRGDVVATRKFTKQ